MENSEATTAYEYDEIERLVVVAFELGEVIADIAIADGTFKKAAAAMGALDDVVKLMALDVPQLKEQWAAFKKNPGHMDTLFDTVKLEFDLADDGLEGRVEKTMEHLFGAVQHMASLAEIWAQ